jgi:hypothetical protein
LSVHDRTRFGKDGRAGQKGAISFKRVESKLCLRLWTRKDCSTSTAERTVIPKFSAGIDSASILGTIVPKGRSLELYQGSNICSDRASIIIAVDIVFKYCSERFEATVLFHSNGSIR